MDHEFKMNDYNNWFQVNNHNIAEFHKHLKELKNLQIFIETPHTNNLSTFRMHYHYKRNLLQSLSYPQQPWQSLSSSTSESSINLKQLDEFSNIQWENLLRYIVGAKMIHYSKISIIKDSLKTKTGNEIDYKERQAYLQQIAKFTESSIRNFLKATKLITEDVATLNSTTASSTSQKSDYTITARGYEYMLKDKFQQV